MSRGTILISLFAAIAVAAQGKILRDWDSSSSGPLTVEVDSIDYRADLTRLYGHLIGKPHTSQRLDSCCLDSEYPGLDIDGVDFTRYFQWEDDGQIAIEIDFAPMKPQPSHRLDVTTVRGKAVTKVERRK